MVKRFDTKMKIFNALDKKSMSIVDLSKKFKLSRATVAQHVRDLEDTGAVNRIENTFFKKMVTYRAVLKTSDTASKEAKLHWRNGNRLFERKEYSSALKEFSRSIELDQKYINAYYNRALTESMLNQLNSAVTDLQIVLKAEPKSYDAAVLMGDIEEKKGSKEKAKLWYQRALEHYPHYAEARDRLEHLNKH